MITASCHCGLVCLDVQAAPSAVTDCNCSICRRYGVLWAYYSLQQVRVRSNGATHSYMWNDHSLAFHRCSNCGCVTHWAPTDPAHDKMAINARLLPVEMLENASIRHFDGATTFRYLD